MYHWKFNGTAGSYALFDGDRPMKLNPPPDCATDDMKRIARALNMEAAMREVREALKALADDWQSHCEVGILLPVGEYELAAYGRARQALAALDRVGEV